MNNIGGGGVANVGKPAEYYKVIDQRIDASKKAKEVILTPSDKFSKILDSQKTSLNKRSFVSRQEQARKALEMQKNRVASKNPTRSDIDSLIKASGLTNDQIKNMVDSGNSQHNPGIDFSSKINSDKNGTNLALKKLAKEMEIQIMSMFYTLMDNAREVNPEGGFGETLFRGQYLSEMVKDSSDKELGEIGLAIYRNLVRDENIKEANDVR